MRISDWSSDVCSSDLVLAACPTATIIRPSVIFGQEDQFTNRLAQMMSLPVVLVMGANTKFQPIYAADVGKAIAIAASDPAHHGGNIYELGGPEVMTMAEINNWIAKATNRDPSFLTIPDSTAGLLVSLTGWMPCAPVTPDQWKMRSEERRVGKECVRTSRSRW